MSSSVDSTFESLPERSDASDSARLDLEKTVIRQGELLDVQDIGSSVPTPVEPVVLRHSSEQLIGKQLDHFLIESLVGTGGMGAVFRGRDLRLDRIVAIKVVPIADRGAEAMRRFRIEAQSAAKLDHPHIARVYYVGETEHWSYIVFEFVEGTNLRELVFKQGVLSIDDAICLTRQVAEALQHANERRVVHRDIKPSNILITQSGQAKLVDMGLARTTELDRSTNDLTASGVTLGTFDYISPEQAHDPREADVRSDIYSLGCTLYFLLTGQPPFPEGTALQKLLMHGTKMPEDPRFFRSDISDSLIAILRKMMAKKPADRYQDPADLIHDLHTLAQLEGLTWSRSTENTINTPDAFQRTWIEATLPLVVSLFTILGITLWLHSVSYRSSTFPIPNEEISEGLETVSDKQLNAPEKTTATTIPSVSAPKTTTDTSIATLPPSNANPSSNSSTKTNRSESVDRETIFVDPESILERDKIAVVVRTMEQAIELANNQSQFKRIVIKGGSVSTSLVTLKSLGNITIQSDTGKRSRWNIDGSESPSDTSAPAAWFDCVSGSVLLQDLDLVWKVSSTSRRRSLFAVKANASLQFKDCSMTVQNDSAYAGLPYDGTTPSAILPSVVLIDQVAVDSISETPSIATPKIAATVSGQRFSVRGQCDWMRVVAPVRLDVRMENSWFAISGAMFDVNGSRTPIRTSFPMRIDLRNVTAYTQRAWMRCNLTNAQPNPIPLVRTARECVFSGSKTYIDWNAQECQDWKIWEQTGRGQELAKWIDLRGTDNVYDSAMLNSYLVARLANGKSEQVELGADTGMIAEERGLETVASWKKRPVLESAKIHEASFSALEWGPGAYQPGFKP